MMNHNFMSHIPCHQGSQKFLWMRYWHIMNIVSVGTKIKGWVKFLSCSNAFEIFCSHDMSDERSWLVCYSPTKSSKKNSKFPPNLFSCNCFHTIHLFPLTFITWDFSFYNESHFGMLDHAIPSNERCGWDLAYFWRTQFPLLCSSKIPDSNYTISTTWWRMRILISNTEVSGEGKLTSILYCTSTLILRLCQEHAADTGNEL